MAAFDSEQYDIDILDNGRTVRDFIDKKIEQLSLEVSVTTLEPFHVADLDDVYKKHLTWSENLPRVKPFYAVKCNNTPAIIRTLSALGTGFDCASKAEIELALSLGATPDRIIFAHTTKPESHIKFARTRGVQMMTFDNQDELSKIAHCHPSAKLVLRIAVDDSSSLRRLNSKFGACPAAAGKLLRRAGELGLDVVGVSFHVGCMCNDTRAYSRAIADAHQTRTFPTSGAKVLRGSTINVALDEFFPPECGVQIIAEPGRYFVESAFTLAVNVIGKRAMMEEAAEQNSNVSTLYVVMMYYVNDGVFGSLSFLINDPASGCVLPYLQKVKHKLHTSPVCLVCLLPELQVGEWLLFDNTGAYTVCLATDFNGFEKAHIFSVVTPETWQVLQDHTSDSAGSVNWTVKDSHCGHSAPGVNGGC
uniref:ornithine decarboxylase n=1 Tax=Myripristis murdjan TaxID=586833 RepID=A0A667WVJ9_9TELE